MAVIQTILDNPRNLVLNISGAAAETVNIVNPATLDPACTQLRLLKVQRDIPAGVAIALTWDATAQAVLLNLGAYCEDMCFDDFGGIPNNAGAGKTGKVNMTVTGTAAYSLILWFAKTDPVR